MESANFVWKRIPALFVSLVLFLILIPSFMISASASEAGGDNSHGYVSDMQLNASIRTDKNIPTFEFSPDKTKYDGVKFIDTSTGTLILTLNENAKTDGSLGYSIYLGDTKIATKAITNVKSKITLAPLFINLTMGEVNNISIRVGTFVDTKSSVTDYDEYLLSASVLPGISKLSVSDSSSEIEISPEFEMGVVYFTDTFTAVSTDDEVALTVTFKNNKNVQCYVGTGEEKIALTSNTAQTIQIKDYIDGDAAAQIAKIPIYLLYDVEEKEKCENTFYLYVADPENFSPVITAQPQGLACKKGSTPELSVEATDPDGNDDLTYQWYKGSVTSNMKAIPDATGPSYTVPEDDTARAGTTYYRCDVTNSINLEAFGELSFVSQSETVAVETELTYVSHPEILRDLGSFKQTETNKFAADYCTTYSAGEKFDTIYIAVEPPEAGVTLSYAYYVNTEQDFETAEILEVKSDKVTAGYDPRVGSFETYGVKPVSGFAEGEYYIWCAVTASAEDGRTAQSISGPVKLTFESLPLDFAKGRGTESDPYIIETEEDFAKIRDYVYNGQWCSGVHFQMGNDIELSADWTPIGGENESLEVNGRTIQAFSGILDGAGHKLTVAPGGKPLFNYVSDAVIKNLNIYGEKIDGNGLIDYMHADYGPDGDYWTGVPDCVTLDGCRLLSGSSTLKAGFMEGSGSGANTITIRNCVVEENVVIGYNKDQNGIGSFVGSMFNGMMENCTSSATVFGQHKVGGLAGKKGQAVGLCEVRNSSFLGTIEATGNWVGGIIAAGYYSDSAPNTVPVSVVNCYVAADITGNDYIGGIFGGEEGLKGALNQCWITDNYYYGTISATGTNVGGLIGWYESVNNLQHIENNYYYDASGTTQNLIGGVGKYWVEEDEKDAIIYGMGSAKTAEEFKNGTVKDLLNAGSDYKNWTQDEDALYPTLFSVSTITSLELSGNYKTEYYLGEELDLTGMEITAVYSDGKITKPTLNDVSITGYDKNKREYQTVTVSYGGAYAEFRVVVKKPATPNAPNTITVYFKLMGDDNHNWADDYIPEEGEAHTLQYGGLKTWISNAAYTVDQNATVADLLDIVAEKHGVVFDNPTGNYVESVTYNGITLGEFDNGKLSGWMYTLNESHPMFGVSEQFLENGDRIIWHYTDDYTKEEGSEKWGGGSSTNKDSDEKVADEVIELIDAIGTVTKDSGSKIAAARTAYDALTDVQKRLVSNYEVLTDAEAEFERLGLPTVAGLPFTDVSGHWALEAIQYVYDKGLMAGTSDTTFAPDVTLNRGMLATILYRLEGEPAVKSAGTYSDVAADAYYAKAVAWATENKIVSGYGNGFFGPADNITREQMAAMLYRYASYKGYDVSRSGDLKFYTDAASIGSWAVDALRWANAEGLINGRTSSTLVPAGTATRAEAATILTRFCQRYVPELTTPEERE